MRRRLAAGGVAAVVLAGLAVGSWATESATSSSSATPTPFSGAAHASISRAAVPVSPRPVTAGTALAAPPTAVPSGAAQVTRPSHARSHPVAPTLQIVVVGQPSYVAIRRDGRTVRQGTYRPGTRLAVSGGRLQVVVGNAGATRIDVDGHRRYATARSGQVLRFRLTGSR